MVVIRMARKGSRNRPFYKIVVADNKSPRDGKFIEKIGFYNPIGEKKLFKIDIKRFQYWLDKGAQSPKTVRSLVKSNI